MEKEAYISPELAEQARQEGNELFKRGPSEGPEMYAKAIAKYEEAMKRNPKDHVPYSNRAACYQKLMEWQLALKDVETCVSMEPSFVKGWSRKASIHFYLKEYHKAMDAYNMVLKYEPDNADAKMRSILSEMQTAPKKAQAAMNDPTIS